MQQCFMCGKETVEKNTMHRKCIKELFALNYLPEIALTLKELIINANKMVGKLSISGVQRKLSMRLNPKTKALETVATQGEYILKPQSDVYPNLPQNENLCMTMALNLGIEVPPHSLLRLKDNSWAYIVKRFDRSMGNKIHQEDFYQILEKQDKYKASLEEIGRAIKNISQIPGLDVQLFFERTLFFFIIGNGDAHLKNFSMSYKDDGGMRLSQAYDIVSSKLVIPDEEDFALSVNGKKNKLTGHDFLAFAAYLNIPEKAQRQSYLNILKNENMIKKFIKHSYLEKAEKQILLKIIDERYLRFKKGIV